MLFLLYASWIDSDWMYIASLLNVTHQLLWSTCYCNYFVCQKTINLNVLNKSFKPREIISSSVAGYRWWLNALTALPSLSFIDLFNYCLYEMIDIPAVTRKSSQDHLCQQWLYGRTLLHLQWYNWLLNTTKHYYICLTI